VDEKRWVEPSVVLTGIFFVWCGKDDDYNTSICILIIAFLSAALAAARKV